MISEDKVEKALHYLGETEEEYAHARASIKANEHLLKAVEAGEYLSMEKGTQEYRKAAARSSQAFLDAIENLKNAEYDYTILAARRERAKLTISTF